MGTLKYDGMSVHFEDRLLAHIQMVVVQKLRRQESFLLSWRDPVELGGGRGSIWMHESALLTFHGLSAESVKIDRVWLEKLMASANSPAGLLVADSEGAAAHPSDHTLND